MVSCDFSDNGLQDTTCDAEGHRRQCERLPKGYSGLKNDFPAITEPDFRSSPHTVLCGRCVTLIATVIGSHKPDPWALATMRWTYYETACRSDG
jgi:hypothetical protein